MEIGTGSGSGYGVRCTAVAVWLKLWSAALLQQGWLPHREASGQLPLHAVPWNVPWNAERHRDWRLLVGALVCAHRGGDTAQRGDCPRGDRAETETSADWLPSQPPPFPLAATTPKQCCANPSRHQAREGCATSHGGAQAMSGCSEGAVCRNRFSGKKTQKQAHFRTQK